MQRRIKVGDYVIYELYNKVWGKVIHINKTRCIFKRIDVWYPFTYDTPLICVKKMTRDEIIMEML